MHIKSVVVAGAILTASLVAVPSAHASLTQCSGLKTCIWGNNGFVYWLKEENNGDGLSALTGNDDNEMDSWANRSNSSSAGYDQFGSGDCQTFGPVSNDDNVNPFNSDEISSWRANGGC